MSATSHNKPPADPEELPQSDNSEEQIQQEMLVESDSVVFTFLAQIGVMGAIWKGTGIEDRIESYKTFKDSGELKILDKEGVLEKHISAKRAIDREIDKKFSSIGLKFKLRFGIITKEQYQQTIKEKFEKKKKLKVGTGKGEFGETITYDEYLKHSQAQEIATETHNRVAEITKNKQYNSAVSTFNLTPEEKTVFNQRFKQWQAKNPKKGFDDFMQGEGIGHIKENTAYGKSKGRKFKNDDEYRNYRYNTRYEAAKELSGAWGDGTSKRLNSEIDKAVDPKGKVLTPQQIAERKEYVRSGVDRDEIREHQKKLAELKAKGFQKTAADLVDISKLEQKIKTLEEKLAASQIQTGPETLPKQQTSTVQTASQSQTASVQPAPQSQPAPQTNQPQETPQTKKISLFERIKTSGKNAVGKIKSVRSGINGGITNFGSVIRNLPVNISDLLIKIQKLFSRILNTVNKAFEFLKSGGVKSAISDGISSVGKAAFNGIKNLIAKRAAAGAAAAAAGGAASTVGLPLMAIGVAVVILIAVGFGIGWTMYRKKMGLMIAKTSVKNALRIKPAAGLQNRIYSWKEFDEKFLSLQKDGERIIMWNEFEKNYLFPAKELVSNK